MKTQIIAILMVALVGLTGAATALPEDLVGWDTPSERAYIYADELIAFENKLVGYGLNSMVVSQRMEIMYYRYSDKLAKYTRMYNYINVTELTTDDGLVDTGNSSIWIGRTGISRGFDEVVVVVPYMQRQVDNKVAELEENECNKNIDTTIVITRIMYTCPGGPIFMLYHFEVTWDIYEELYN
jgi:hypothetical protein